MMDLPADLVLTPTPVQYAWFGTTLLVLAILIIEGRHWLRSRRRLLAFSMSGLFVCMAGVAWCSDGATAMGWLHPDIIDRLERFIMTVGFSVFTALWFMFRAEKRLDENNKLQTEQIALLKQLLGIKEGK